VFDRRGRLRAGMALVARASFSIVIAGLGVGLEPQLGPLSAAYVLFLAVLGPSSSAQLNRLLHNRSIDQNFLRSSLKDQPFQAPEKRTIPIVDMNPANKPTVTFGKLQIA